MHETQAVIEMEHVASRQHWRHAQQPRETGRRERHVRRKPWMGYGYGSRMYPELAEALSRRACGARDLDRPVDDTNGRLAPHATLSVSRDPVLAAPGDITCMNKRKDQKIRPGAEPRMTRGRPLEPYRRRRPIDAVSERCP
jgi:hypothetical protein